MDIYYFIVRGSIAANPVKNKSKLQQNYKNGISIVSNKQQYIYIFRNCLM